MGGLGYRVVGGLGFGVEGLEGLCLDLHRMTSCSGGSCKAHVRVGQNQGLSGTMGMY